MGYSTSGVVETPFTREGLLNYFAARGGIARSRDHWDPKLTYKENSRQYGFRDRVWGRGVPLDELAQECALNFPWFQIEDESDLFDYING